MNSVLQKDQIDHQDVAAVVPSFHLPDGASSMQDALARALDACAKKMNLPSPQAGLEQVRAGEPGALEYCHYRLAQQVAEALGQLDDHVQSVSLYEFEATAEDRAFAENPRSLPIHLLVQVDRKTSALNALIAALDRALVRDYSEMIGPRRLRHVLDVQVIDQGDVESRRGIAALLTSLYNRPLVLWAR